ncbi:unnamed protein product [Ectocarpus sp. 4 AP-2014]
MMKFRRRESERGDFQQAVQQDVGRPPQPASSKRVSDAFQASPEPTPVAVPIPASNAPQSTASTPGNKSSDTTTITTQTPDNVIGETLVVQGRVEFQNLLRIDGHFEGELIGNGSLIIGPTAEVISNLRGLNEVYVEGILIGDCSCNKMQIRFAGCVTGNLICASLGMDPSVVLKGSANINPREKVEKTKSKSAAPRHKQGSRSQTRSAEDTSSRASTSALSPESVGSRGSTYDKQKRRASEGGDLRPEGARPEVGAAGAGHGREPSDDSSSSSGMGDDTPLPLPLMSANGGKDKAGPKMPSGDAVSRSSAPKAPVQDGASVPVRKTPVV